MASTFSTNKDLELPGNGDYVDTWNVPLNADMNILDAALGGVTNLNSTTGSVNLTASQYQKLILNITGTLVGNVTYVIPNAVGGQWIVRNATSGAFTVTIASGGGGSSLAVAQGSVDTVYSDGTNIRTSKTVTSIPAGLISMWSGSIVSIPSGWLLCDGTNGTPDLRNRFIVGAGSTYAVNATGGSADAIVVSHTHTASVNDPGHTHTTTFNASAIGHAQGGGTNPLTTVAPPVNATTQNYTSQSNTTGILVSNSTTGSSGTNANLPPYFALAYIMKS
jgi:hypothetical protein